jgi:hypothetical protein
MERLKEFGSREEKAKKVLICLTSSQGKKARKSLSELSPGTGIELVELKAIMKEMIDMRMARAAGEDEFEIIHDYLASVVDEELVVEEDRIVKFLLEQLESYQQNYAAHKTPIMSPPFLAYLYRNRVKIKIGEEKYPLILCTCLLEEYGLGWYWLKDIERSQMLEMLKTNISYGKEDIREKAVNGFASLAAPEDKENILDMLTDAEDGYVRQGTAAAFVRIATPEDREKIIDMVKDEEIDVKKTGVYIFLKITGHGEHEYLLDLLAEQCQGWSEKQLEVFKLLSEVDKRLYCPYYEEEIKISIFDFEKYRRI